ncbi:hypothetical protein AAL_01190 [Moelleriella libera RCEF 2490]|uniref:Defect at low temperature protein 1 n=1 Tax=Moelleriella libera RCEF 2490 TaxID=1081109 RepID=A0A166RST0_9HYPO|nr:hypothetical protein AAL_01190 [Moelleriella libera RCEF 2490]
MHYRRLFSRILYASVYVLFFLVLLGLLLITPGDAIERSLSNNQKYNVLILTISYVVTVLIVVFVYMLRLYITKSAIAAIPKAWVPIEKGDLKDVVYRMIQGGLNRSAVIAYEARPREQLDDIGSRDGDGDGDAGGQGHTSEGRRGRTQTQTGAEDWGLPLPPRRHVWGEIEHPGWASPNSPDLPNLQYSSVISELPNLIEARALTLAPPGPDEGDGALPDDAGASALMQRTLDMTLRDYVDHLCRLGVAPAGEPTANFLARYEYARFSARPISSQQFRELMRLFAELLRAMQSPGGADSSAQSFEDDHGGGSYGWAASESDIDNDAPMDTDPPSPGSSSGVSRPATLSTQGSVQRRPRPPMRTPSGGQAGSSFRTAPNTPGSMRPRRLSSRQSSENSFAQTRRHLECKFWIYTYT